MVAARGWEERDWGVVQWVESLIWEDERVLDRGYGDGYTAV